MLSSKSSDTPFLGSPDTLEIRQAEHPFSFRNSKDEKLNALIVEAVNRMGGVGDDAEENYRRALNSLTKRGPSVLDVILAEYENLPEDSIWTVGHSCNSSSNFAIQKHSNRSTESLLPGFPQRNL